MVQLEMVTTSDVEWILAASYNTCWKSGSVTKARFISMRVAQGRDMPATGVKWPFISCTHWSRGTLDFTKSFGSQPSESMLWNIIVGKCTFCFPQLYYSCIAVIKFDIFDHIDQVISFWQFLVVLMVFTGLLHGFEFFSSLRHLKSRNSLSAAINWTPSCYNDVVKCCWRIFNQSHRISQSGPDMSSYGFRRWS